MQSQEPYLSAEDFWDLTKIYPTGRYEYIRGIVRDLRVLNLATLNRHERIVANCALAIGSKLREKKSLCRVYGSNTYFFLSEEEGNEEYVLPDLSVSCDAEDHKREKGILHPSLIVEVLSKGTKQDDRTWKKDDYLAHPSIQSYLIIDPNQALVTVYQRQENEGPFQETVCKDHDGIQLTYLGINVDLDDIYYEVW